MPNNPTTLDPIQISNHDSMAVSNVVFENLLGRIDGRVYYNLVNWYRALALLPGFAINRAHMETMMGVGEPLPAAIADSSRRSTAPEPPWATESYGSREGCPGSDARTSRSGTCLQPTISW